LRPRTLPGKEKEEKKKEKTWRKEKGERGGVERWESQLLIRIRKIA